ncbi:hypothetical protein V2J09_005001 [Rumex salicifolius]
MLEERCLLGLLFIDKFVYLSTNQAFFPNFEVIMPPFAPGSSSTSQNNTKIRMAGKQTFHVEVENDLRGFAILLKSVACEWLLIFFILFDAVYLYFLKKFARYCNLKLPCMLCSRLDHIFGNEKPDFYKDLICNEHRSKLSSLVFCHSHGSLADVHDVCEECLLSFATKKDSSPEIYKFLIGKLGLDGLRNPVSEMDFFHGFVSVKSCSCCNKQWRCRPNVQKLVKSQSFGSRSSKPDNIPLPTTPHHQKLLNRGNAVLKGRERIAVATAPLFLGVPESDSMEKAGNSELKISSDHEFDKLDCADQQQGAGFSFKKQFEEKFKTKKNGQGEDYDDKKDGMTMTNFHTQAQTPFKDITVSKKGPSMERSESQEKTKGEQNSTITELNKQIEESQECIDRLRIELEEERNAAAEAANQAMAMITKLQEEKAVLNMDAQQYLRMMEEQAEHDLEALENTNDLLAEREKEMQDMEAELEFYRMKYPDEYEEEFAHTELISQGMGILGGKTSL